MATPSARTPARRATAASEDVRYIQDQDLFNTWDKVLSLLLHVKPANSQELLEQVVTKAKEQNPEKVERWLSKRQQSGRPVPADSLKTPVKPPTPDPIPDPTPDPVDEAVNAAANFNPIYPAVCNGKTFSLAHQVHYKLRLAH
eukprot:RCo050642